MDGEPIKWDEEADVVVLGCGGGGGEILDVRGNPIKRLYGVGELGSIWGFLYQSGGNLGECLALGRIVGFNVAAEVVRS